VISDSLGSAAWRSQEYLREPTISVTKFLIREPTVSVPACGRQG